MAVKSNWKVSAAEPPQQPMEFHRLEGFYIGVTTDSAGTDSLLLNILGQESCLLIDYDAAAQLYDALGQRLCKIAPEQKQ